VTIFHSVFETFLCDLHTVQPSKEDLIHTQELIHAASEIYSHKKDYASALWQKLSLILDVSLVKEEFPDGTSPDGLYAVVLKYKQIPILILEFQREYGEGGSDASMQGGLYMKQLWIQTDREDIRSQCCCPTFIIAGEAD